LQAQRFERFFPRQQSLALACNSDPHSFEANTVHVGLAWAEAVAVAVGTDWIGRAVTCLLQAWRDLSARGARGYNERSLVDSLREVMCSEEREKWKAKPKTFSMDIKADCPDFSAIG
jgi:hypothetical protein